MRNVSSREPPNLDQVTAEELVEDNDGMAFAAFSTVTDEVFALPLYYHVRSWLTSVRLGPLHLS